MSSYNLTDNVNDSFEFSIKEMVYQMRYPRVEEIEKMQEMVSASETTKNELIRAQRSGDTTDNIEERVKKQEKELNDWVYTFISAKTEGAEPIQKVMKSMNLKVLQNFQTMFKTEFGIE